MALIESERDQLVHRLCARILGTRGPGGPISFADNKREVPKVLAQAFLDELASRGFSPTSAISVSPQNVGDEFDIEVAEYVKQTFVGGAAALRPGSFRVERGLHIRETSQYRHLEDLRRLAEDPTIIPLPLRREFEVATAGDYAVKTDITILRDPVPNGVLFGGRRPLLDTGSPAGAATPLRTGNPGAKDLLHANVSCKWTLRSDRAQNIRTEALTLMRHRKGPMPHMVVVTLEVVPSRLVSVALGTGEIDCVYHVHVDALEAALRRARSAPGIPLRRQTAIDDHIKKFELLRNGDRLRDITDLPLDLAV